MIDGSSHSLQGLLQTGFQLLQQRRAEEAWTAFHEVLRLDPDNALAHHMVGLIAMQAGQLEMGIESMRRSIALQSDDPVAHGNLGNGLRNLGRMDEALAAYARALAMAPNFLDALNNRAILHGRAGRPGDALQDYDRAIALEPRIAFLHNNRADALRALGRPDEALASYDRALQLDPNSAEVHYNRANQLVELHRREEAARDYAAAIILKPGYVEAHVNFGNLLLDLDRQAEALAHYDQALALQGDLAEALVNRSNALRALRRPDEALLSSEQALALNPGDARAHANRGAALLELGKCDEAVASFDAAIAARPDLAPAFSNRGNALRALGRHAEALDSCDVAIQLDPTYADPLHNRATILGELGRHQEAIADYDACLALKPDLADAALNGATAYLALGDYARGWERYERRFDMRGPKRFVIDRGFAQPRWRGDSSIAGKTILLHSEQGLGDSLQFCRYADLAKAAGARVILEVEKPLVRLFFSLKGADVVLEKGSDLPDFDLHASLMSLPFAFRTTLDTVPADVPYLHADAHEVRAWTARLDAHLGGRPRPRVGLVWSGGFRPDHPQLWNINRRRNISLEALAPLAAADVDFVSLQKGEPAEGELRTMEAQGWSGPAIADFAADLHDFAATAALIEALDLVVAVDTSTAHLAGALGKPVWIFNRFDSCWRWLQDRTDSPWYPTARLFRQEIFGEWGPVVEEMVTALSQFRPEGSPWTDLARAREACETNTMTTIHDIVLGPAKPERACGDCVACCKVLNIDEPDMLKPADQMCMHCTGKGCGIYATRPEVCRTWDCAWRRIASMPIETRPDKLGVVFTIDRQANPQTLFDRLYFVGRAVGWPGALHTQDTLNVASMLAHGFLPIFISWGNERQMIYPREELAAAILDPQGPHDPALVEQGRVWREKFEPFARLSDEVTQKLASLAVAR